MLREHMCTALLAADRVEHALRRMRHRLREYDDTGYPRPTGRRGTRQVPWWERALAPESGRGWLTAGAVVVALVLVFSAVEAIASNGRVHPGVYVGGVSVGGLSPAAAQAKLEVELAKRAATPVTITYGSDSWKARAADLGLRFDSRQLATEAMGVGRSKGFFRDSGDRFASWFRPARLPAAAAVDQTKLDAFMDQIDSKVAIKPTNASISVAGTKFTLSPSAMGRALERDQFTGLLLPSFTSDARTVAAPVAPVQPTIPDSAAQGALATARAFVSAPALITFGAKRWRVAPETLARWTAFRTLDATASSSASSALQAYISSAEVSSALLPKVGAVGAPPVNARFKTRNGIVTVIPSKDGTGPDIAGLSVALTSALADPSGPRSAELRISRRHPALTTAAAQAMGVKERISTFTTTYDSGNAPRVNNIHLLGNAMDGKLVPPGAVFSFNGYIGERTAAKGYKEANAIVQGKLVPQLGGGICQVGTTMFNAVFFSGLPVIERQNHSFYISHYPKGRDATVSWGGPDLKWKNETKNWILVSVSYSSSSITISLYGTSPGYDVSYATSPFSNIRPFPTQFVKDPTVLSGVKFVTDKGENGMTCTVTRTVRKGGSDIRVDKFLSVYNPKIQVVTVGTLPEPSKTASGTPTPKP